MDWKPKYKPMTKVTEVDKGNYLCLVNGKVVKSVSLEKSRAVRVSLTKKKVSIFSSSEPSQNKPSARVNLKTRKTLDRGIQLYRLWFNFLKLALELEEQGVSIVTKNHTSIKNWRNANPPIPKEVLEKSLNLKGGSLSSGKGATQEIFRCKRIQKVKVKRGAYKGWDLDRVLSEDFNTWWFGHEGWGYKWKKVGNKKEREFIPNPDLDDEKRRGHSYLFEGHYPTIISSKNEWVDDPNFVYVRIDKTSQWTDVSNFMFEELNKIIKTDGRKRYKISGKPRVKVCQNNFNALVLLIEGKTPKEICLDKNIYLRKTDEKYDAKRTKTESLTIPTDGKGKPLYSLVVSKQKWMGVHHLMEVCQGRFGYVRKE